MSVLVILLVYACSVWAAPSNVNITQNHVKQSSVFEPRIVGGSPSDILPYQVSLRIKGASPIPTPSSLFHFCGGALISKNFALTAAFNFQAQIENVIPEGRIYAVIGTRSINFDPETTFVTKVEALMKHPLYNPKKLHNDIAVVKLKDSIPADNPNIHPIPMISAETAAGEKCKISGWGYISSSGGEVPDLLQSAMVPIVYTAKCLQILTAIGYKENISPGQMCAGGDQEARSPCQGDSGGPLVCSEKLAGIISWGHEKCDTPGVPGVYSSVAYYRDFIETAMKALSMAPPPTTAQPSTTAKPNSARKPAFAIPLNIFGLLAIALTWMSLKLRL